LAWVNKPGRAIPLALSGRLSFIPLQTGQRLAGEGNNCMTEATTAAPEVAPTPGPVAGIGITAIVVVLLVAWTLLAAVALHVPPTELVGGYMLLWYWANNEQLQFKRLPATIIGALVGIGIAWLLIYATITYGGSGTAVALAVLILALYLDVIKALPLAINPSTFLFVTLAAAPLVQLHVNWMQLVISTVFGGVFFGLVVEGLQRMAAKAAAGKS
jgi:hypothetical protein